MATPNPSEELKLQQAIVSEIKQQLQLYEQLMAKKKEISQTDYRAQSELNKQLKAWNQLNQSVDRVKDDLKSAEAELKGLSKEAQKAAKALEKQQKAVEDLTENFSELDAFQRSITREYGEQSEETRRVSKNIDAIKANVGGIGKFLKQNVDLEDNQREALMDAADTMKSMPISIDKANKKLKRNTISHKTYNNIIEDASEHYEEIADRLSSLKVNPSIVKSVREFGKSALADAEASRKYTDYIQKKQRNVAPSAFLSQLPGGQGASQLLDAATEPNPQLKGLKGALAGAAIGAELGQLAIGLREYIPGMKDMYYFFADKFAPKIAEAEGEVNVQQALFNRNFKLGSQLGSKYAGQMYYAAEASKDFGFEMANLAAEFRAAAKTAFFGHGVGSVGYAAGAMQLAGVGAQQVASALTDIASGANVNFFGTTLGAQAAVFSREMGVSTQSIAEIMSGFRRLDGSSGKTALNLTYSAAKLADMKGMNIGVILNDMAQASGKLLEYNIKNKDAFVQQAISIRQMGGNLPRFADAMNNQIMNFQEATKAQISLSNILNRPVDLSVATALAYSGDMAGAYQNIKQSGILEAVKGGGIIAKNVFKQAMGGYGIDEFQAAMETGKSVGLAGSMNAENKSFLDRVVGAQGGLRVAQAQIAADKAILDAQFAKAFQTALQSDPAYREAFKTADSLNAAAAALQHLVTGLITGGAAGLGALAVSRGMGMKLGSGMVSKIAGAPRGAASGASTLASTSGAALNPWGWVDKNGNPLNMSQATMKITAGGTRTFEQGIAEMGLASEAGIGAAAGASRLSKFMKVGGKGLAVVGAGYDLYDRLENKNQNFGQAALGVGAGVGAGWAGAQLGAELGLLGGPFAEITVPLGALLGGAIGYFGGSTIADKISGADAPKQISSGGSGDMITILKNIELLVADIAAGDAGIQLIMNGKDISNALIQHQMSGKGNFSKSTLNQVLGNGK